MEEVLAPALAGAPWAWGYNGFGELGNGTATDSGVPVQVLNLTGASALAGGGFHSLALKDDGTIWAWGHNGSGQLGDGTTTGSSVPVQVSGLTGVSALAGGDGHSLALKSDGTVWAWGSNEGGQLGDGTITDSSVPVQVLNLTGVSALAGGYGHSLAIVGGGASCALDCTASVPASAAANTPVSFQSTATLTPPGCATPAYDWDFGDGSAHSTLQNPSHTYTAAGAYSWALTAYAGTVACTKSGTVTVVNPPVIVLMKKAAPPFKIVVKGSNLQSGIKIYISGVEWMSVLWKKATKILLTGGKSLKTAVPKGTTQTFRFVNPDGGEAVQIWGW